VFIRARDEKRWHLSLYIFHGASSKNISRFWHFHSLLCTKCDRSGEGTIIIECRAHWLGSTAIPVVFARDDALSADKKHPGSKKKSRCTCIIFFETPTGSPEKARKCQPLAAALQSAVSKRAAKKITADAFFIV